MPQELPRTGTPVMPSADRNAPDASPFERMSDRIARNREILGLHYRSDSEAGKALSETTVALYLDQCPSAGRLFAAAKAEWCEFAGLQ